MYHGELIFGKGGLCMTFEEFKATLAQQYDAIRDLVASFAREETFQNFTIRWFMGEFYDHWTICDPDPGSACHRFMPALVPLKEGDAINLRNLVGPMLSRYAEIKTALEAWVAGTGEWPEPKQP
jgi:hypothetical protein